MHFDQNVVLDFVADYVPFRLRGDYLLDFCDIALVFALWYCLFRAGLARRLTSAATIAFALATIGIWLLEPRFWDLSSQMDRDNMATIFVEDNGPLLFALAALMACVRAVRRRNRHASLALANGLAWTGVCWFLLAFGKSFIERWDAVVDAIVEEDIRAAIVVFLPLLVAPLVAGLSLRTAAPRRIFAEGGAIFAGALVAGMASVVVFFGMVVCSRYIGGVTSHLVLAVVILVLAVSGAVFQRMVLLLPVFALLAGGTWEKAYEWWLIPASRSLLAPPPLFPAPVPAPAEPQISPAKQHDQALMDALSDE